MRWPNWHRASGDAWCAADRAARLRCARRRPRRCGISLGTRRWSAQEPDNAAAWLELAAQTAGGRRGVVPGRQGQPLRRPSWPSYRVGGAGHAGAAAGDASATPRGNAAMNWNAPPTRALWLRRSARAMTRRGATPTATSCATVVARWLTTTSRAADRGGRCRRRPAARSIARPSSGNGAKRATRRNAVHALATTSGTAPQR